MPPSGGKRVGAGRPSKEPTKPVRIPVSKLALVTQMLKTSVPDNMVSLPLYSSKVQAGFPSPADDYIERYLDLNAEFIKHPSSTFILRATGDSMIDAGIFSGDMLLVDRSLTPTDGKIVIAAVNGELTVKRLKYNHQQIQLVAANPAFQPINITDNEELVIWGVVILVFHEPT